MHNKMGFVQNSCKKQIKTETCGECVIFENQYDKLKEIWTHSTIYSWS